MKQSQARLSNNIKVFQKSYWLISFGKSGKSIGNSQNKHENFLNTTYQIIWINKT